MTLSLARSEEDLQRPCALKYMIIKVAMSAQTNVYSTCAGSAASESRTKSRWPSC
jgi:hypothetical protein